MDETLRDALLKIERALCDNAGNRLTREMVTGLFGTISEAVGAAWATRPPAGAALVASGTYPPPTGQAEILPLAPQAELPDCELPREARDAR